MGCAYSREDHLSEEELMLVKAQESLNISDNSCMIVNFCFQKYSYEGKINQNQWEDIVFTLDLQTKRSPHIAKFLDTFREDQLLIVKPLLLAVVMLSSGLPRQKFRILCELYIGYDKPQIHESVLCQIASDMIEVAVEKLPMLLSKAHQVSMYTYLSRLKKLRDAALTKFISKLMGNHVFEDNGCIDVSKLLEVCARHPKSQLFTPQGLRAYIKQVSRQDQAKHLAKSRQALNQTNSTEVLQASSDQANESQ